MNPLGGLFKIAAAGVLVWAWANGHLTRMIDATIAAFSTPPAPKTPTFPAVPRSAGTWGGK